MSHRRKGDITVKQGREGGPKDLGRVTIEEEGGDDPYIAMYGQRALELDRGWIVNVFGDTRGKTGEDLEKALLEGVDHFLARAKRPEADAPDRVMQYAFIQKIMEMLITELRTDG